MKILFVILFVAATCHWSVAQVKHNFEKGPENTDCHLIPAGLPPDSLKNHILQSTFRLSESVKISQYSNPASLEYRSCNGAEGYLLSFSTDSSVLIYDQVPYKTWQGLLNSEDIRTAFADFSRSHSAIH